MVFFLAFFLWLICDWRRAKCKVSTKSVAYCVARACMCVCVGNTRRAMSLPARLPLPLSAIAKIRFDFRSLCSLLCRTNAERANRAGSAMQWQPHLNFAHGMCVCVPLRVAAEFAIFLQNRGGLGLVQQQQLSKLSTPNKVCQKFHEVNRARGSLPVVASTNDCKNQ